MPYRYAQPKNWGAIRKRVLIRDGHTCRCGAPATQVDAIVPDSQGGSHEDEDNLVSICEACHAPKSEAERRAGVRAWRTRMSTKRKPETHPNTL